MKRTLFFFALLCTTVALSAQLTLEACRQKAQDNYPLVQKYGLIENAKEYNLSNAAKGYLPQFSLTARATYQSEVTELPIKLEGINVSGLPKDQYQAVVELNQNIWDGGVIRNRKELVKATSDVDREQLAVNMYALNERVDQLFFGILLLDEQRVQNQLLQEELGRNHAQIQSYMDNGVANQSDLDAVRVEQLNTQQKRIELDATRKAYWQMLAILIGEDANREPALVNPSEELVPVADVRRPELTWYEAQENRLSVQEQQLKTGYMPRLGAFVQGGYGNPGLNMLKDGFSAYYIAGVRLSWNFGSLYTLRNDKKLINTNRQQVATNREVFLFNTRLQTTKLSGAIESMKRQMRDDDEIIRLRTNIRVAAEAKVANGTLTVTELLREITAESLAKQTKAQHEVQLLMNIWQLKYTVNN